jgi:hypothetical protein
VGILDAASEAAVRAAFEITLPDRCAVRRTTSITDSTGAWAPADTDVATGVPCRVDKDQAADHEDLRAGRVIALGNYTVTVSAVASRWPGGAIDIQANDQVVVTGSGAGTYQPKGSGGPTTDEWERPIATLKIG